MAISNFDVLKRMSADNLDIRLATSENILSMNKVKAGTQITFGVPSDILNGVYSNELHCCMLTWNRQQFLNTKAKMEAEAGDEKV